MKWAVLGCGHIARDFINSIRLLEGQEVVSCASKSAERAESLANEFSIPSRYENYESMLIKEQIDAVYIATTHNFHFENALLCLKYEKHLLIEKPMCINAAQALEVFKIADSKSLFVMEAVWTRFLPFVALLRAEIDSGAIGKVSIVNADFGFAASLDFNSRLFNRSLAGGALLDIGMYTITFADLVYQSHPAIEDVSSHAILAETGVDCTSAYVLNYGDQGGLAKLSASVVSNLGKDAVVFGTKGKILVKDFFFAQGFRVVADSGEQRRVDAPYSGPGKQFEILETIKCIEKGLTESPQMTHQQTVEMLATMDEFRREWGVIYPDEET